MIEKDISQGEVVEARKKLFTISDLSTVWIFVDVYEKDLTKIRMGTERGRSPSMRTAEKPFADLWIILQTLSIPETRAVQVRVKVPNPNRQLKPGMFATATFEGPASQDSKKAAYLPRRPFST